MKNKERTRYVDNEGRDIPDFFIIELLTSDVYFEIKTIKIEEAELQLLKEFIAALNKKYPELKR